MKKMAFLYSMYGGGLDFFVKYLNWAQATLGFRKPQVMPGATFRTTRKLFRGLSSRDLMVNGSCTTTALQHHRTYYYLATLYILPGWLERARFFNSTILSATLYILDNMFNRIGKCSLYFLWQ